MWSFDCKENVKLKVFKGYNLTVTLLVNHAKRILFFLPPFALWAFWLNNSWHTVHLKRCPESSFLFLLNLCTGRREQAWLSALSVLWETGWGEESCCPPKHALVYTTKEKTAVKYQMPACLFKKKKKAVTALSCVSILVKQLARLQSPQLIKVTKAEKENETETARTWSWHLLKAMNERGGNNSVASK